MPNLPIDDMLVQHHQERQAEQAAKPPRPTLRAMPHDKIIAPNGHTSEPPDYREEPQDSAPPGKPSPLKSIDGLQIYNTEFEQLSAVIHGLLFRGVTLFAGRPKVGKSWLTLLIALAMARGKSLWGKFGIDQPGRVVYCALEEPASRTAARLKKIMPQADPLLMNLHFIYTLTPLMAGGAAELDAYLTSNPAELVIIDTLSAIVQASTKRDVFRSDYNEVNTIRQLAEKHKTAILVVTHLRKMGAEYGLDAVAGTTGLTAACDAIWTLRRQSDGNSLLEVTGREMEEKALSLQFDTSDITFGWNLLGEGNDMRVSAERKEIIELLRDDGAMDPKAIADALSKNRSSIRSLLRKLAEDGDLIKDGKKYQLVGVKYAK